MTRIDRRRFVQLSGAGVAAGADRPLDVRLVSELRLEPVADAAIAQFAGAHGTAGLDEL